MCPHGAYTCWGPQGSINVHVALVCLNTASNRMCMHLWGMWKIFVDGIECNEDDWSWFCCCVNILFFFNNVFISSWVYKIFVKVNWVA